MEDKIQQVFDSLSYEEQFNLLESYVTKGKRIEAIKSLDASCKAKGINPNGRDLINFLGGLYNEFGFNLNNKF